jgi:hypothetical protein
MNYEFVINRLNHLLLTLSKQRSKNSKSKIDFIQCSSSYETCENSFP